MFQVNRQRYFQRQHVCCLATIAVTVLSVMIAPASAQTRSADIKAKERQDPASGDVVIINRRTGKKNAPNPYAPKNRATAKDKTKIKSPAKTAAPKPVIRRQREVARAAPDLTPPLPGRNTSTARLGQFPRTELRRRNGRASEFPAPRRVAKPPINRRAIARRRSAPPRNNLRERPWRRCRILARRCQSGFEGSCYAWQRRCT